MEHEEGESYRVRHAEHRDLNRLCSMRLELQAHMEGANRYLVPMSANGIAALPDRYRAELESSHVQVIVVEQVATSELVGMAVGRTVTRDDLVVDRLGSIDDVWIDIAHRRSGLARRAIAELRRGFEAAGVKQLVLNYAVGNAEAEATWASLGFKPILIMATVPL